MKAYWFEPYDGRLGYGDGRLPEVGVTHTVEGPIELCRGGLHASLRPLDALAYAHSPRLWIVDMPDDALRGNDKVCARSRTYVRRVDLSPVLREFACRCALSVAHLWHMPDDVRRYLETGNAAYAASAAADAGRAAAYAASAAADAGRAAAYAASAATAYAAYAAARAADAAYAATTYAAAQAASVARAAAYAAADIAADAADVAYTAESDAQNALLEFLIEREQS